MEERLQKYMARCGIASRRKCEEIILEGKIKVNGTVITEVGTKIDPEKDIVEYNNNIIKVEEKKVYIMLNKPEGYITSVKDEKGIINLPIGRHPTQPHKMAVVDDGKPSITEYKVLERFKNSTYIELTLKTGRTHQIRVHMSYFRTPVFNDTLYGARPEKIKTQEQVLQAYKLEFTKPFSNEIIKLQIEPDEKIQKVLKYLRSQK